MRVRVRQHRLGDALAFKPIPHRQHGITRLCAVDLWIDKKRNPEPQRGNEEV